MDLHVTEAEQCTAPTGLIVNLFISIDSDDASFLFFILSASYTLEMSAKAGVWDQVPHYCTSFQSDAQLHRSPVKHILAGKQIIEGQLLIPVIHIRWRCFLFAFSMFK